MSDWKPISTAPRERVPMIVVQAFSVPVQQGALRYTSDPYAVWWGDHSQEWVRWPHDFQPTHWMPLPAPPAPEAPDA